MEQYHTQGNSENSLFAKPASLRAFIMGWDGQSQINLSEVADKENYVRTLLARFHPKKGFIERMAGTMILHPISQYDKYRLRMKVTDSILEALEGGVNRFEIDAILSRLANQHAIRNAPVGMRLPPQPIQNTELE